MSGSTIESPPVASLSRDARRLIAVSAQTFTERAAAYRNAAQRRRVRVRGSACAVQQRGVPARQCCSALRCRGLSEADAWKRYDNHGH